MYSSSNDIKVFKKACGNGINSNLFKSNTERFMFQLDCHPCDKEVGSVTKRMYDCVTPPVTIYLNCHSPVIYLINCRSHYNTLVKQYKN